jgi:hypothetical protein
MNAIVSCPAHGDETPARGRADEWPAVHAVVSFEGPQVHEFDEQPHPAGGAAAFPPMKGKGAVEVPDRLPLARPAGCFIASRPNRRGEHVGSSARRERLPSSERHPAARSGQPDDCRFGGIAQSEMTSATETHPSASERPAEPARNTRARRLPRRFHQAW